MRRTMIIVGAILLVLVVGLGAAVLLRGGGGEPAQESARQAEASLGDITITVSAAGTVAPEQVASLYFGPGVSGVVESVRVEMGERVRQYEPLAHVRSEGLEIAREQAVLEYDIQKLVSEQFLEPPTETELAAARAEVGAASARYADTSTVDPELLEIEQLEAEQAVHSFRSAEINYRALAPRSTDAGEGNAHAAAGIAWVQGEIARLEYEQMLAGPRAEDVAVSAAEVGLAAAELREAEAGPSALEVERTEVQLQRAQVGLDRANEELAETIIRAPFDGVVALVNLREGTPAPTDAAAIEVVDDSRFHVEVEVDEIDINRVEVGQRVFVELDALPDRQLTGRVTSIAPSATTDTGGVVSYIVRVDLEPSDVPLLSGMTATVDIAVEQREGVLRIPNWAIRIDRRTGETFVNVRGPDGGLLEVEIELGLRGDTFSQVVSGLEEGEEVVVSLEREDLSFFGGEE